MKKKFIKIIAMALATVCAVATLGACGGAFSKIDGWLDKVFGAAPDDTTLDTSGSGNVDNANSDEDGFEEDKWFDITDNVGGFYEETLPALTVPTNVSELTTNGLAYTGAQINLLDKSKMTFRVNVTKDVLDLVNSSVGITLGAIIADIGTLEAFNDDKYTVIDWGNEMLGTGYTYGLDKAPVLGENHITLTDMRVEDYGKKYVCIPFIRTTVDRGQTFKYADMSAGGKTYRDYACSMAYIASSYLNTHLKNGMLTEEQEKLCKEIISGATERLTGTNLNNETAFPKIKTDVLVTIKNGATGKLRVGFEPDVKLETLFTCSDTNVATVDEYTGEVVAKATGNAIITILVGGKVYSVKLTVTE